MKLFDRISHWPYAARLVVALPVGLFAALLLCVVKLGEACDRLLNRLM